MCFSASMGYSEAHRGRGQTHSASPGFIKPFGEDCSIAPVLFRRLKGLDHEFDYLHILAAVGV